MQINKEWKIWNKEEVIVKLEKEVKKLVPK